MTTGSILMTGGQNNEWKCSLALDSRRNRAAGSLEGLVRAIRRGADLRIGTAFRHNEHIDTTSPNAELIEEVAEFRVTYLLEDRWVAGIMTLRQPVHLPRGFGPRPSMSFFLYNQDGSQAIARPYLDGLPATGQIGPGLLDDWSHMPRYHQEDAWDTNTNAPSSNFVYDFEYFRFWTRDDWQEACAHDECGNIHAGSVEALSEAFRSGREVKLGVRGLCGDLRAADSSIVEHEVFVQAGSCYYYTEQGLFIAGSHPFVRVRPAIPLRYRSRAWDFGWLVARTDGRVDLWLVEPYTLKFARNDGHAAMRWFYR